MKRTLLVAIAAAGFAGLPAFSAPLPVGFLSRDVGYSEATEFNGSNYQTLVPRQASNHSETVLALIFATPW